MAKSPSHAATVRPRNLRGTCAGCTEGWRRIRRPASSATILTSAVWPTRSALAPATPMRGCPERPPAGRVHRVRTGRSVDRGSPGDALPVSLTANARGRPHSRGAAARSRLLPRREEPGMLPRRHPKSHEPDRPRRDLVRQGLCPSVASEPGGRASDRTPSVIRRSVSCRGSRQRNSSARAYRRPRPVRSAPTCRPSSRAQGHGGGGAASAGPGGRIGNDLSRGRSRLAPVRFRHPLRPSRTVRRGGSPLHGPQHGALACVGSPSSVTRSAQNCRCRRGARNRWERRASGARSDGVDVVRVHAHDPSRRMEAPALPARRTARRCARRQTGRRARGSRTATKGRRS